MSEILIQLHTELQKEEQDKEKIFKLIDQAILEDRTLSQTTKIETKENSALYTVVGIILEFSKNEIVKDLFDKVFSESCVDINAIASVREDKIKITTVGMAVIFNRTEIIEDFFKKYPNPREQIAIINEKLGSTVTIFGLAVEIFQDDIIKNLLKNYPDIIYDVASRFYDGNNRTVFGNILKRSSKYINYIKTILKHYPDLINRYARICVNGDKLTGLGIAINQNNSEVIKILLENDLDLKIDNVAIFADGKIYSALGFAVIRANQNIANIEKYKEKIKTLLENGVNYDEFDGKDKEICPPILQTEINKIKKTKKVFDGDLSIPAHKINQNYLKYLCKKSGIPQHFLTISSEKPLSSVYSEIVSSFKTKEDEIKENLNIFLGLLLNSDNSQYFPVISGYDLLLDERFAKSDEELKAIESYEQKPHLKPDNFLNNEKFAEKLALLTRNQPIADEFFKITKDWILPQNQQPFLLKLRKEYYKIYHEITITYTQEHQLLIRKEEEISQRDKQLSELKKQLSELKKQLSQRDKELSKLKQELSERDEKLLKVEEICGRIVKSSSLIEGSTDNQQNIARPQPETLSTNSSVRALTIRNRSLSRSKSI